ncbi:MAG: hypothetical protein Q9208_003912 [Pyrenodesmia sp. 3 TL-2023]
MSRMTRGSSLDRTGNLTRITTENIIRADTSRRLTRRGSRETPASTRTATDTQTPQFRGQTDAPQQRRQSAEVSTDNILSSPNAARLTRRGTAGHVSAIRAPSNRQERRYDPATRAGRPAWLGQRPDKARRKRVRFAVALTRSEARDLLEQADRMTAQQVDGNGSQGGNKDDSPPTDQIDEVAEASPPAPLGTEQSPNHFNDFEYYEEAAAAVEQSLDPIFHIIQRLALRAAADPDLRALMRIVAAGNAPLNDLEEFQITMYEVEMRNEVTQQSQGGSRQVAASDSSSEPESDTSDKENVPPPVPDGAFPLPPLPRAPPRAPQNNNPPIPSGDTPELPATRGPGQRYALEELPIAAPTESFPEGGSGPQIVSIPPQMSAPHATPRRPIQHPGHRVDFTGHAVDSPRFRRRMDQRLERSSPGLTATGSPIRGLGSIADYLPLSTPPRPYPLGAAPPSTGSRTSSPLQVADGSPEIDPQSQIEGVDLPRGAPGSRPGN